MGETSVYVFALDDRPLFVEESLARLVEAGVISSEEEDADVSMYGPGDAPWADGAFEYLGIHRSRLPYIIPQDPAIEPKCPGCGADVSEAYYETVNGIEEEGEEVDWSEVKVDCSGCRQAFLITELKDSVGVFCAREYLYFADVSVDDLGAFEARLRGVLRDAEVKTYWST